MDVLRTAFQTSLVLELSASLATALVAVEISLRLVNGDVGFARALAVLVVTPEFFLPLRQLAVEVPRRRRGKGGGERLFAILDTPIEQAERAASHARHRAGRRHSASSTCRSRTARTGLPALMRRVAATSGAGTTTALVGPIGRRQVNDRQPAAGLRPARGGHGARRRNRPAGAIDTDALAGKRRLGAAAAASVRTEPWRRTSAWRDPVRATTR